MTTNPTTPARDTSEFWATGVSPFAGSVLMLLGLLQMLQGLAVLADDEFLMAVNGYAYRLDTMAWGWVHLLIGALACVIGILVVRGKLVGPGAAMVLAGVSATACFLFIPYYPLWTLVLIALAVTVIWAVATYDPESS